MSAKLAQVVQQLRDASPGETVAVPLGYHVGGMLITNVHGADELPIILEGQGATISGRHAHKPIEVRECSNLTIRNLNVCESTQNCVNVRESSKITLSQICGWDAFDGNSNVIGVHTSSDCEVLDCAGWGVARKTMSCSQSGDRVHWKRCWARWEACHAIGPKSVYEIGYNNQECTWENCLGTWDQSRMMMPYVLRDYDGQPWKGEVELLDEVNQPYGIFAAGSTGALRQVLRNCCAYVHPDHPWDGRWGFYFKHARFCEIHDSVASMPDQDTSYWLSGNATTACQHSNLHQYETNRYAIRDAWGLPLSLDNDGTPAIDSLLRVWKDSPIVWRVKNLAGVDILQDLVDVRDRFGQERPFSACDVKS